MVDASIKLLKKQISKLREDGFDLEAWKSSSALVLSRIFGEEDPKVKQLRDIRMDFGSWSLRDTGASRDPLGSCKKQGKEILEMAIDELEAFGFPVRGDDLVSKALESVLTVKQHKELYELLSGGKGDHEVRKGIEKFLGRTGAKVNVSILTEILMNRKGKGR